MLLNGILATVIALATSLCARPIISIFCGVNYSSSVIVLQILSFSIFSYVLNHTIAIIGFMNFGLSKIVSNVALRGALLNLVISPPLVYYYGHVGLALDVLIVDSFVIVNNVYYYRKYIKQSPSSFRLTTVSM